jgi:hypothetical protein
MQLYAIQLSEERVFWTSLFLIIEKCDILDWSTVIIEFFERYVNMYRCHQVMLPQSETRNSVLENEHCQ